MNSFYLRFQCTLLKVYLPTIVWPISSVNENSDHTKSTSGHENTTPNIVQSVVHAKVLQRNKLLGKSRVKWKFLCSASELRWETHVMIKFPDSCGSSRRKYFNPDESPE